jgi:RNA polymerase-associated protein
MTLYDADRCPYCARVRLVLAEKDVPHETVVVDLADRPAWIYEKNATGRVPVLEEDAFVLPESDVICEYLEERYPEPPLLPADPAERALARLAIFRFDGRLGDDYYALRRGQEGAADGLDARLADLDAELEARPFLTGREFGLADVAYLPWVLRARERLGVSLEPFPALSAWVARCLERPSVAAELELAGAR